MNTDPFQSDCRLGPGKRAAIVAEEKNGAAPNTGAGEPLMTSTEVCVWLKISKDALQGHRDNGRIPFTRVSRHRLIYRKSEILDHWEAARVFPHERKVPFIAEPYSETKRPDRKWRVRRGCGKQCYFRTEEEARAYAGKKNNAAGREPVKVPEIVRGMDPDGPLWRVLEYDAPRQAYYHFRVTAKIEGQWQNRLCRTSREAYKLAGKLNFQIVEQRARDGIAAEVSRQVDEIVRARHADNEAVRRTSRAADVQGLTEPGALTLKEEEMQGPFRVYSAEKWKSRHSPFFVDACIRGKRERKFFKTEKEARQYAHVRNTQAEQQGLEALNFPSWLRVMAQKCAQDLQPFNRSIEDATKHYIEMLKRTAKTETLGELIKLCCKSKKAAGVSNHYLADLEKYYGQFSALTGPGTFASEVTTRQVNDYLMTLERFNGTSRNFVRQMLGCKAPWPFPDGGPRRFLFARES